MTLLFVNKVYIMIQNAQTACFITPVGRFTEFTVNIATSRWTSNTIGQDQRMVILWSSPPFSI